MLNVILALSILSALQFTTATKYLGIVDSETRAVGIKARYVKECGVQYVGNNLQYVAGDLTECKKACWTTRGCVGFNIDNTVNSGCQLKSNLIGHTLTSANIDTYKFTIYSTPLLNTQTYVTDYNTDYSSPSNDISYQAVPFPQCAELCSSDPNCVAYTLDLTSKQGCWLKSELANQTKCHGRATYKKIITVPVPELAYDHGIVATRVYVSDPSFDYHGNDIKYVAIRINECFSECDKTVGCVAITMGFRGCWLKDAAANRRQNPGRYSFRLLA